MISSNTAIKIQISIVPSQLEVRARRGGLLMSYTGTLTLVIFFIEQLMVIGRWSDKLVSRSNTEKDRTELTSLTKKYLTSKTKRLKGLLFVLTISCKCVRSPTFVLPKLFLEWTRHAWHAWCTAPP